MAAALAAMARPDHGKMAMNKVILDISRLISRIRHRTPSGVDRVEMAYARRPYAALWR